MEPIVTIKLGVIEITPVWDGTLDANVEGIRGLEPAAVGRLLDSARRTTGVDPLVLPVRAFLVKSRGGLTLVDAGSGTTKGPSMGRLPASLKALGVAAREIGAIVMTHLHMDHVGGLVDAAGMAAFPAAALVMHAAEAAYVLDLDPALIDARSRRHVDTQRAIVGAYAGRVRRVQDGEDVGGLVAALAPGHTPGHTVWLASSGGRRLMVLGDVVHLAAVQLPEPDTAMIYDVDPVLASATRHRLLRRLAAERILVAGAHLPAPGIGVIETASAGYRFVPALA